MIDTQHAATSYTQGGGVFAETGITSYLSTVTSNRTPATQHSLHDAGGGVFADSGAPFVSDSTFDDNAAGVGGGLALYGGSSVFMSTTVSSNAGGGIYAHLGSLTLWSDTIAFNNASGATDGGGVWITPAYSALNLINSIVAANTADGSASDIGPISVID